MKQSDVIHYECSGPLRKRSEQEKASWYFFTIPEKVSEQIKVIAKLTPRKGWGSVRVKAKIGRLDRETSIFPDSKSGCYFLPIKVDVRKKLELKEGDVISLFVDLV